MNREIFFRGKEKDTGKWKYGDLIQDFSLKDSYYIGDNDCNEVGDVYYQTFIVVPETIGQYTDLKDKNGKKIFEGDIIIAHDTKFIVKFGAYRTQLFEKKYGSAIHTKQFGWYAESIENKEQCNLVIPNDIEVIGNIYENELESKGE